MMLAYNVRVSYRVSNIFMYEKIFVEIYNVVFFIIYIKIYNIYKILDNYYTHFFTVQSNYYTFCK